MTNIKFKFYTIVLVLLLLFSAMSYALPPGNPTYHNGMYKIVMKFECYRHVDGKGAKFTEGFNGNMVWDPSVDSYGADLKILNTKGADIIDGGLTLKFDYGSDSTTQIAKGTSWSSIEDKKFRGECMSELAGLLRTDVLNKQNKKKTSISGIGKAICTPYSGSPSQCNLKWHAKWLAPLKS